MFWLERFARHVAVDMGAGAGFATPPMKGAYVKEVAVRGPLARALKIGRTIMDPRAKRHNVVERLLSRASDMSGLGSAWFVRFLNRRSHVAGGSDGACFGCDRLASCGTTELRGGWGATGIERASFSSVAGRVRGSWRGRAGRPAARTGEFVSRSRGRSGVVGGDVWAAGFVFHAQT